MSAKPPNLRRFLSEVGELAGTARQTWRMLARSHRYALLAAVAVMAVGGFAATALPLLSGRLVDRVATGLQSGEPRVAILAAVGSVLLSIAGLVLVRELLQVLRRYLVENTCTRIERHMSVKVICRSVHTA